MFSDKPNEHYMVVKFSKHLERSQKLKLIGDFKVKIKVIGMQFYFWLNVKDIIDYSNLPANAL